MCGIVGHYRHGYSEEALRAVLELCVAARAIKVVGYQYKIPVTGKFNSKLLIVQPVASNSMARPLTHAVS